MINPHQPKSYKLEQNYPNPFNSSTSIRYELPEDSHVQIEIFSSIGKKIKTLINDKHMPGIYAVSWDGTDASNYHTASGIYICRMISGHFVKSIKLAMIK